jgi:hypothetical protein
MIEEEPRHGWSPILQNRHETARCDVGGDVVAEQVGEPKPIEHGTDRQVNVVDNEAAFDGGMDDATVLGKVPTEEGAVWQTIADAIVVTQVAR